MFQALAHDIVVALPLLGWLGVGLAALTLEILFRSQRITTVTVLLGLIGLLVYSYVSANPKEAISVFAGTAVWDGLSQAFNMIALAIVVAVVFLSLPGLNEKSSKIFRSSYEHFSEFLLCLVFSGFGASVMASATDLTSLFLGLEILSMGSYCLCGFYRSELKSTESGLKYLLIGAFATAVLLYGIAFIYGASGATGYEGILRHLPSAPSALVVMGVLFLIAGLAFKLAFVPFHLYTADVYEGAPTPVTAYLATMTKVGVLAAGLRIFWGFLAPLTHIWQPLWIELCLLSLLVGSLAALQQTTLKRLLAFSSVAHAGFLGLGLLVASPENGGLFPLMAYLVVYSAMTLGAFGLVHWIEDRSAESLRLEDLRGLGQRRFIWSALLSVIVLGLAGIPPFAGFMIKFWILQGLISQGFIAVSIVAIVASLIGAGYYLRILMLLFMSEPRTHAAPLQALGDRFYALRLVIIAGVIITVVGALRPQLYADWIFTVLALK